MKKGDLVITANGEKGIIIDLYNNFSGDLVAIIQLDNERRFKSLANDLTPIEDEPEESEDEPEDRTVTISAREFYDIVDDLCSKESGGDINIRVLFSLFGAKLGLRLFGKVGND